jgi:hypothetical protein
VNVERLPEGDSFYARVTLTPVYVFPLLDDNYQLIGTERRVYADEVVMYIGFDGAVVQVPEPASLLMMGAGVLGLLGAARRRRAQAQG